MSFYKRRVDYGAEIFGDESGDIGLERVTHNAGKQLLSIRRSNASDDLIALTSKAWTMNGEGEPLRNSVWKAGLPGSVCYRWFNSHMLPKVSDMLIDTITMRRDYESPGAETKLDEINISSQMWVGYRFLAACMRWFDVFDDNWLWTSWHATEYMSGISREDKLYDMLFVKIPFFVTQNNPEILNYKTGDYDELLRFLRAVYSLAVMTGKAEELFEESMMMPLLESYEEVMGQDLSELYFLWESPYAEDVYPNLKDEGFLLNLENKLLGRRDRDPDKMNSYNNKTRLSFNQIIDIANLFKYIDVRSGSYFWLDKFINLRGTAAPKINVSRVKRRKTLTQSWKISFAVEGVWIDPVADLHIIYDKKRRELKRILPPVGEVVYRALASTPSYNFIDIEKLKGDLEAASEQKAMELVYRKLGDLDPTYREWFNPEDGEESLRAITIYNNEMGSKGEISFVSAVKKDFREYYVLASYIFHVMTTVNIPRDTVLNKMKDGIFKAKVNENVKRVLDIYLQNKLGLQLKELEYVGDYFILSLCGLLGVKPNQLTDFTGLFFAHQDKMFYNLCKSVLTVLTCSPRTSKYFVKSMDPTHEGEYASRAKLVEEIEADKSNSKRYWSGDEVLREIKRCTPYNVYTTEDIFLRELLKVKLY